MRSGFVNVVAWVFIVLGAFSTLIAALQNLMMTLVFPLDEMRQSMDQAEHAQPMPGWFRFMFDHIRLWFALYLLLSVVTLVSAIGLLRRANWARLVFIGIMAIGLLWNLSGLAMPFLMSSFLPQLPPTAPNDFQQTFELMMNVMMVVTVVISLAVAGLFAWIIKRLVSTDVKREFLEEAP